MPPILPNLNRKLVKELSVGDVEPGTILRGRRLRQTPPSVVTNSQRSAQVSTSDNVTVGHAVNVAGGERTRRFTVGDIVNAPEAKWPFLGRSFSLTVCHTGSRRKQPRCLVGETTEGVFFEEESHTP